VPRVVRRARLRSAAREVSQMPPRNEVGLGRLGPGHRLRLKRSGIAWTVMPAAWARIVIDASTPGLRVNDCTAFEG
jgi:hypothetical protein